MTRLEYLIEQAAILVKDGKATLENAFKMAIEQDNERILTLANEARRMRSNQNPADYIKPLIEGMARNVYNKIRKGK